MFESFKDFIEQQQDDELFEAYDNFLKTGDDKKMMKRLKELGLDMRDDMATGGRVDLQTGGITETRILPPEYIEALGKTYTADLTKTAGTIYYYSASTTTW